MTIYKRRKLEFFIVNDKTLWKNRGRTASLKLLMEEQRLCVWCNKPLERKRRRRRNEQETVRQFATRKYCNQACHLSHAFAVKNRRPTANESMPMPIPGPGRPFGFRLSMKARQSEWARIRRANAGRRNALAIPLSVRLEWLRRGRERQQRLAQLDLASMPRLR